MKKLKKILLIYEKNNKTGFGHYKRLSYLNDYLKKRFNTTIKELKKSKKKDYLNNDIVIFDLNKYDPIFFKKNKLFNKSVTFDNFENHVSKLNINVFEQNKKSKGIRYSSLKYVILPKKLKKFKIYPNEKDFFFISLGSRDTKNFLPKVVVKLKRKNYSFKIGSLIKKKIFLKNYVSQKNFYNEFANSSICIVNAGVTLTEGLFMNKLCIVLPQSNRERKFADYLLKKNYILGIGLNTLNQDLNKRKGIVLQKINKVLDNKADFRIIKLIKKYYNFY